MGKRKPDLPQGTLDLLILKALSAGELHGLADSADFRRAEVTRLLESEHGCTPVFLPADQQTGFYEGFSNSSIWPLLHYMPSRFRYDPAWWAASRNRLNVRRAARSVPAPGSV